MTVMVTVTVTVVVTVTVTVMVTVTVTGTYKDEHDQSANHARPREHLRLVQNAAADHGVDEQEPDGLRLVLWDVTRCLNQLRGRARILPRERPRRHRFFNRTRSRIL
jgi:hypothetical protein